MLRLPEIEDAFAFGLGSVIGRGKALETVFSVAPVIAQYPGTVVLTLEIAEVDTAIDGSVIGRRASLQGASRRPRFQVRAPGLSWQLYAPYRQAENQNYSKIIQNTGMDLFGQSDTLMDISQLKQCDVPN